MIESGVTSLPIVNEPGLLGRDSMPRKRPVWKGLDAAWHGLGRAAARLRCRPTVYLSAARNVDSLSSDFSSLSNDDLRAQALALRTIFRRGRDRRADVLRGMALVREVAHRTLGQRPYLVQLAGALAIADGCIAEMATGEGKTLTATLPATIAGWRGRGCHIVTVNDYLAERDAEWMARIYEFCGLRVSSVVASTPVHARREAYACDVTYSTNKELAADFLRDQLALQGVRSNAAALSRAPGRGGTSILAELVQRGLHTAIVDEADSVLIDEAVTPLIIAGASPNQEQVEAYIRAALLARECRPNEHYRVNHALREVTLLPPGRLYVENVPEPLPGSMRGLRRREELMTQAITARELFVLGKHYVINDHKIAIVDEFTGRLMPDRTWQNGLHQAIEAKESLPINPPNETLARVSFQRYFQSYRHLSGMSGTARELRGELWTTYATPVVRIPTNKPSLRVHAPSETFASASSKWKRVVELIKHAHQRGQPVLVGCASVQASEYLGGLIADLGIPCSILNARNAKEEAAIIERAGERGTVTIATNMAGRGTDIRLTSEARSLGGLFVLATERQESSRVDRQLFGRSGRQGDPGLVQVVASLEDDVIVRHASWSRFLTVLPIKRTHTIPRWLAAVAFSTAQRRAQKKARAQRRSVLLTDDWLDESLAFAS